MQVGILGAGRSFRRNQGWSTQALYIFTTKIYRDPTLPLLHRKSAIVGLIILSCLVWGVLYKPSHWTRLDQDVDMTVKVIWTVVYTWAVHVQVAWKGLLNKNKNEGTWSCGSYECCSLGSTHFVVCPHIVSTSLCYISLFLGSWNISSSQSVQFSISVFLN